MSQTLTLKPGGACQLPSVVVFVDCEPSICSSCGHGSQETHSFAAGYATVCRLSSGKLDDKEKLAFNRPEMFWDLLAKHRDRDKCTWVFGHNIGYDLTLLGFWSWLERGPVSLVSCCLDDPPTIVTVRVARRLIRFVDVMNYWRLSVDDLDLAATKPKAGACSSAYTPRCQSRSCQHDVEVIESCMLRLIRHLATTRCCSLKPTAASLSWATYRKSFQPKTLTVSLGLRERRMAREAYFGGRVTAFVSGLVRETVHGLDCNSMYPSVMKDNLYPCRLLSHPCGMRPADLRAALRDYDAVADVDLWPGKYPYPTRTAGGIDYLRGLSRAVLAGNELRHAFSCGDVRKVHDCYIYERADLFSGFVNHFYKCKQAAVAAGNRADTMICKLILNCLHGKFAQRGHKWQPAPDTISRGYYDYWWHKRRGDGPPIRYRSIAGVVERQEEAEQPKHCFPAISACITANVRVRLENDIQLAGPHNVLYCDTDSLHVVDDGFARLGRSSRASPDALGLYRVVVTGADAHYYGRQHYRIGDHHVCSSIKPDAVEISDGIFLQDAYQGVERVLENGTLDRVNVSPRIINMNARSRDAKKAFVQCG